MATTSDPSRIFRPAINESSCISVNVQLDKGDEGEGAIFFGAPAAPKRACRELPIHLAFLKRARQLVCDGVASVLGGTAPPPGAYSVGFNALCGAQNEVCVVVELGQGPFLANLAGRREFYQRLHQVLVLQQGEVLVRRCLPFLAASQHYEHTFEPATLIDYEESMLQRRVKLVGETILDARVRRPGTSWAPPLAPTPPEAVELRDFVRQSTQVSDLDLKDHSAGRVWLRACSVFTCPGGFQHPAGTTIVAQSMPGDWVMSECRGDHVPVSGFPKGVCCRAYYRKPRSAFELPADHYLDIPDGQLHMGALPEGLVEKLTDTGGFTATGLLLRAGYCVGKSSALMRYNKSFLIENEEAHSVWVASHKSLVDSAHTGNSTMLAGLVEPFHYGEVRGKTITAEQRAKLTGSGTAGRSMAVTCGNSFGRTLSHGRKPRLTIMDETESLVPMLSVGGKLDTAKNVVEALRASAKSTIIAADANADTKTMNLFKAAGLDVCIMEVRGLKPYKRWTAQTVVSATCGSPEDYESYALDENYAAAHIYKLWKAGHSVAVPCSHASHSKVLAHVLRSKGVRVEVLTGDMTEAAKRRALLVFEGGDPGEPLVFLYSAALAAGVSAAPGLFTRVVAVVHHMGPSADTLAQMIFRSRPFGDRADHVDIIVVDWVLLPTSAWNVDDTLVNSRALDERERQYVDLSRKRLALPPAAAKAKLPNQLRVLDLLAYTGGGGAAPPCVLFRGLNGKADMMQRLTRQPPKPPTTHEDMLAKMSKSSRLHTAGQLAGFEEAGLSAIQHAAEGLPQHLTGNKHLDQCLTSGRLEEANRPSDFLRELEAKVANTVGQMLPHRLVRHVRGDAADLDIPIMTECFEARAAVSGAEVLSIAKYIDEYCFIGHKQCPWKDEDVRHVAGVKLFEKTGPGVKEGLALEQLAAAEGSSAPYDEAALKHFFLAGPLGIGAQALKALVTDVLEAVPEDAAPWKQMKAVLDKNSSTLAVYRAFIKLSQGVLVWDKTQMAEQNLTKLGVGDHFKADVTKEFELARLVEVLAILDKDLSLFSNPELPQLAEGDKRLPALAAALGAKRKPSRKMDAGAPKLLQGVMQSLLDLVRKVGLGTPTVRLRGSTGGRVNTRTLKLPPLVQRFVAGEPDGDWKQVIEYGREFWGAVKAPQGGGAV